MDGAIIKYDQIKHLISLIKESFKDVELEDGVSIHQTEVLDMYGTKNELKKARKKDTLDNWEELVGNKRFIDIHGVGGPAFLDAKGLRYYAPAYLTMLVQDHKDCPDGCRSLTYMLTQSYCMEHSDVINVFTRKQKTCIRKVLKWYANNTGADPHTEKNEIEDAIQKYWMPNE